MKPHPLDNPVWSALTTEQTRLSHGSGQARRYPAAVAPFAAVPRPEGTAAELAGLATAGEALYLVDVAPPLRDAWTVLSHGTVVQMVRQRPIEPPAASREPVVLTPADAADMTALTSLVFPGFFRPRTVEMGTWIGIREAGRLVAMAGERMRLTGHQEISGVCTHPGYLGRGYAAFLVARLANACLDRGVVPFLHVGSENERAKRLYARLGFEPRRHLPLWLIRRGLV